MNGRMRRTFFALMFAAVASSAVAQTVATRELTVRLSTGGDAVRADVVALRGADFAGSATCDEHGRVQVPAGTDRLIVAGATAVPCDVALTPDATEVVLHVARLAGRVVIDGAPPQAPLSVGLVASPRKASLPREVEKIIGMARFMSASAQTRADGAGSFDFGLYPEALGGWIGLPRDFGAPPGDRVGREAGLRFDRPAGNLVIEAHALPHLTGRVLDPDGRPAVKVSISVELGGFGGGATSGDDGRFSFVLSDQGWKSGQIRFSTPTARGVFDLGPGTGPLDIGDVRLEAFETLEVDVRDPDGHPLAGAVVSTLDRKAASAPSGPDGHVSFGQHVAADAKLCASLLGYESCELNLDARTTTPLVVVLRPVSTLTLDIVLPDGRPAPMLRLQILALHGLYAKGDPEARRYLREMGATMVNGCETATGTGCAAWAYLPQGHAVIPGIAPGASFDVSVADRCGHPLRAREAMSVAKGEHASRRWVLDRAPRDVTVEVRGPDGTLVRGGVAAECMDATGQDSQGRCVITNVFGNDLTFRAGAPPESGLGRTDQLTRAVPDDGVIVVQLVPARTIVIEAVNEDGAPVAASGYSHFGNTTTDLAPATDGRWTLGGYGEGEIRIEVWSGDLVGSLVHDTVVPVARVVVKPRAR